ncbi:efflux transporter outer membrane subunit [Pararhodobacter aggregans]|uniref:RND transporter n=1 Tax=Pararhodobacter aggregans TaxID=404875 RepID=A0A2T7UUJ5_9RHOB|nr:efflux transporter outer membrane subunit [Pararhodobacter aggregans]PTX04090.1 multidrug efflux system outer membrane protein [Pararhodobacter aggregans]PVE48445.1 RND transporter [Pararhodobacter aggregans]
MIASITRPLGALAALSLLAGCALGPDPSARPELSLPVTYVEGDAIPVGEVAARAFWSDYNDPMLSALIAQGLNANLSVQAADERIRAARAGLRGTGVLASQLAGESSVATLRSDPGTGAISRLESGTLSAGFVLDLFGGAQRTRQAAGAALLSAEAGAQTARLAWIAEVIAAYGNARFYQESMALTRQTLASRERTVEITRGIIAAGGATQFELSQAQAELDLARADLPSLQAAFNAQVFGLALLLDRPAAPLVAEMQRGSAMLRVPATPRAGVPAELLRNRPDVREAEHQLQAAVARVGVAEADLYPSLSLIGSVASSNPGTDSWRFGPQLSLPLLNQTALRSVRDTRVSEAAQAEIAWRAAVSRAVNDVQTAQSNLRNFRQRTDLMRQADQSLRQAYGLAEQSFADGSLLLLDLLQVERSRAQARLGVASAQNDAAQAWAQLQIALGAGSAIR